MLGYSIQPDADGEWLDSFIAQHKVTGDHLGYWYVKTEFKGIKHNGAVDGILNLSISTFLPPNIPLD